MNFNIICTQDDPEFSKYENAVKERKVKFTIKQIFRDWWNFFLNDHPSYNIRDVVYKNVNKILQCKTFDLGYSEYECPNCHKSLIVPNTCKSRFCSSCGNKYNEARTISIFAKLFKHPHRHVVFTIPRNLENILEKIEKDLIIFLKLQLLQLNIGLKKSIRRIHLHLLLYQFFIHMEEV